MIRYLKQAIHDNKGKQIIFLPFAGGYSNSFRFVTPFIPEDWNIISFDPPGHGPNITSLLNDQSILLEWYLAQLRPIITENTIIMGHSLGGMMAYLVAQVLAAEGNPVKQLVISATTTPNFVQERSKVAHIDDDLLLNYVIALGGIPKELLEQKDILRYLLPVFRADFSVLESVEPLNEDNKLNIPTLLFSGQYDSVSPVTEVDEWRRFTDVKKHVEFPDGHMFILNYANQIFQNIFES
ncbi:thioesterase II family protein [Bacillus wiedmannii]|uniref:thioesterase II family protein n=1 Tax=Bacillus wiedmannii TaxID=1890302 RepID=UPI0015CEF50E|nr:alpha/beta fold hydrolase [Bacillus wiedmannii]